MADSLVFDFPDPTPHFDFDNFSNGGGSAGGLSYSSREGGTPASSSTPTTTTKKTSSKKSRALFKSRFMNKGSNSNNSQQQQQRPASPVPARSSQHIPNNGDDSPLNKSMGDQSGTTATTASMSVGSSNFSPNRLQYGNKHNNHHMIGRTASSGSPKSSSGKTPTTGVAPPPTTSNTGRESPRFEFSLFDDPSPSPKSGMRKSLLSNKPNPYSNLTSTNLSTSNHQRNHSGDGNNLYTAYGLSSDRTAASGYISEVSEFSFDRVTVTTERTGMSSNVSWNFMEGSQQLGGGGGVLGALGSSNNNGGGGSSKLKPPDIDKLLLDDDLLNGPNHHDSHGNRMNVFTGEIHERCDQSVISEISEGIDGHDDNGNGMDFINSILMEKYEDGDVVHHHQQHHQMQKGDGKGVGPVLQRRPSSPTQQQLASGNNNRSTVAAAAAGPTSTTPLRKQSSNNNNTISTVSTSANNSGGGLSSVESAYGKYKQQQRNNTNSKKKTENRSLLKSIMEDIQFCGMYFCGLDTTVEDDGQLTDNRDVLQGSPSKEARAKEMDSTFLGKFVNCAACGSDS